VAFLYRKTPRAPSFYTRLNGKTLKIWRAEYLDEDSNMHAGTVVRTEKDALVVQTKEGCLALLEVQLEGKKRMDTGAFLRGFPVETGTVLTN